MPVCNVKSLKVITLPRPLAPLHVGVYRRDRFYVEVMWFHLGQKSFPMSKEQFEQQLEAVAYILTDWRVQDQVFLCISFASVVATPTPSYACKVWLMTCPLSPVHVIALPPLPCVLIVYAPSM